ncbi:MAG: fibronectin type III domain-containing protein [Cystobacterineae bacterium]|nr:fibronectin type III domain-containing protein [Cystobacterineae bacterium]
MSHISPQIKTRAMPLLLCAVALSLYPESSSAQVSPPQEYVLMLSAQISASPASIRLTWPSKPTPLSSYSVYRKTKEATSWGTPIATLSGSATSYEDTNLAVGQAYEYRVVSGSYAGYIFAGIQVPAVEFRGTVVLLVEAEQAAALSVELENFEKNLLGDGWTVLRHDISRNATPQSAKAFIQADYEAAPNHVNAVILLGHIPVFTSGNIMPDGHTDHRGPWPADAYYGTMSASWENSPSTIPGEVHLQLGRVDFDKMPAFQQNATELLRQYLNKNHNYRMGRMRTTQDALVSEGFARTQADNAGVFNGYKLFPALWGAGVRIDEGAWAPNLSRDTYTWAHINGPGNYTSCVAVGGSLTTSHIASAQNFGIIFAQTFGSYFGDWDTTNNLMRAFLATPDYGLANAWTGRPHWFFHHMALGETLGYSTRLTQNNRAGGLYTPTGSFANYIHIALMGDPTLRMFPVLPVTNLQASSMPGETRLQWTASEDSAVSGYYVYGAPNPDGPYRRLSIVQASHWTHANPGDTTHYMVRASKLTSTGSGSFYNLSQGTMAVAETTVAGIEAAALHLTAPLTGATPNTTVSTCGTNFTCSDVTWTPEGELFEGNTPYTATVTLTADNGYAFSEGFAASINGQAATVRGNDGATVMLSYEFAATSTARVDNIAILAQPAKLSYTEGSALELSGLLLRLNFNDGSTENVPFLEFAAHNLTTEPVDGAVLSMAQNGTSVTITYNGSPIQATTEPLTVTTKPLETTTEPLEVAPMGMLVGGCNTAGGPWGVVALLSLVGLSFAVRKPRS